MTAPDPFIAGCEDAQDHASPAQARQAARSLRSSLTDEQRAVADGIAKRTRREQGLPEHVEDESAAAAAVAAVTGAKRSDERPGAA